MTPRQADIAFVLEGISGVRDVYALDRRSAGDFDFAVRLEHGGQPVARAHYALLRVLTHEECKAVLFFELDLPPSFRDRAVRLELSADERSAASARVPLTTPALEQLPAPRLPSVSSASLEFRTLIVDADVEVHRTIARALGESADYVIVPNPIDAYLKTRSRWFNLIVCDARLAFGGNGFLRMLRQADRETASRVLLIGHEGERDLLMNSLDELGCWVSFLCRPFDVEEFSEMLMTGTVIQKWRIPIPPPRAPLAATSTVASIAKRPRVLVVDDDPTSAMLLSSMQGSNFDATVTCDEWEALDHIDAGAPDLVVCSLSLRTRGGTPFYRLLWKAHPELKTRFIFIASVDGAPSSTSSGRPAPVVERPLTKAVLAELLTRFA